VTASSTQLACFDIKSAHLGLVALVFKTLDTQAIAAELHQRFSDFPDFFDQDAVAIDLSAAIDDGTVCADIDWQAWLAMLGAYNMLPLAVRGVPEAWKEPLLHHNLAWMAPSVVQASTGDAADTPKATAQTVAQPTSATPATSATPSATASTQAQAALIVDKPLRSGQRVYAKGRDLVVMAMVNPGAEVIADGHIHVYAPLRGRAIAGARGDTNARIFALSFEPELVSIAGVYQSIDGDLPTGVKGHTAQVLLKVDNGEERLIYQAIAR
jgi:septum site-determining protein MinC